MKVTFERATTWITVKGSLWTRNGYSKDYVDSFGDVWLKPYFNTANVYVTIDQPAICFSVKDGNLVEA